jgi:phage/plasmid-associated DNA primase
VSPNRPIFGPISDGPEDDIDLQLLIRKFAVECCLFDQRQSETPRDLFAAFKKWMRSQGRSKAGGKQSFIREFRHVMPSIATANVAGGRVFVGIGLRRGHR